MSVHDQWEVLGDFEELINLDTLKMIGTRRIEHDPARPYGVDGKREFTITEPIIVQRGHKTVRIFASAKRPMRLRTYAQAICGKKIYAPKN